MSGAEAIASVKQKASWFTCRNTATICSSECAFLGIVLVFSSGLRPSLTSNLLCASFRVLGHSLGGALAQYAQSGHSQPAPSRNNAHRLVQPGNRAGSHHAQQDSTPRSQLSHRRVTKPRAKGVSTVLLGRFRDPARSQENYSANFLAGIFPCPLKFQSLLWRGRKELSLGGATILNECN
jgi:hypothetical protein